jgi:biofilm protein TabA
MITDTIGNLERYDKLGIHAKEIDAFITSAKIALPPDGRYDILGDDLFALVQTYDTKEDSLCYPEAHEKYADLQYMLMGMEIMGWQLADVLELTEDRRQGEDILFYKKAERKADIKLEQDMFVLLFPGEVHTPCLCHGNRAEVHKIVFKIRVPHII